MIPIIKPWIGEEEAEATRRPLLSGWVTQGPEVAAFEEELAQYLGAPHACCVANCTAALHLALHALEVGPGHEVITVSHSFIATANAIRTCGAVPVFVDIDPRTCNLDTDRVEAAIGPRTRAVLAVHQMGQPCDLSRLVPLCEHHGLPLVEDAACAIGSEILWNGEWQKIGRPHGHVACFSFHPRKLLTTGDGGLLTTRDPDLDQRFRLLRQHGMSVPDTTRHGSPQVIFEDYVEVGFNYRMTDLQAAVGRVQLGRLPEVIQRRRSLVERYRELLAPISALEVPTEPPWARGNVQSFRVRLPRGTDQKAVMQHLLDHGVASRRGIHNAHREPAYRRAPWRCGTEPCLEDCPPGSCERLRHSEDAQERDLLLPLFHQITDEEIQKVAEVLGEALRG